MTNTPVMIVLLEGGTEDPEWTLSVQGSADRARVELRTSRVRMVIARDVADSDVMSQVLGSADDLEEIQGRLRRLAEEVPEPTDAMLLHEMPYDVHTELLTTLECVAEDNLEEAIEKLRAAAAVTPDQLREHWEKSRAPEPDAERPGSDAE